MKSNYNNIYLYSLPGTTAFIHIKKAKKKYGFVVENPKTQIDTRTNRPTDRQINRSKPSLGNLIYEYEYNNYYYYFMFMAVSFVFFFFYFYGFRGVLLFGTGVY